MAQTIATISQADGPISVEREGQTIELHQGDGLYETDSIKTGETSAELIFADDSRATLGPETTITLSDFAYGEGQEPSMVVDMSMGLVHFLSGKVVEQNPEAFQLITPKATVGIRGTGFVYKITLANGETFFLTSIGEGHDVVVTDRTGQRLVLNTPGQGTVIDDGIDETIEMREFSPQEVKEFVDQIKAAKDVLELEEDDDEKSILDSDEELLELEEDDDDKSLVDSEGQDDEIVEDTKTTVTTLFEGDEAEALANVYALEAALEEAGVEATVTLVTFEPPVEEAQGDNPPPQSEALPPAGEGSSTPSPDPFTSIDGTSSYYAEAEADLAVDTVMQDSQLRIASDITTDVTITGDFKSMSSGTITAGNDIINGQNMTNGTIVGDGESVSGGTLIAGQDTINLQNKSGGNSIYGDIESATGGNIHFAADTITITGDFSNSAIYGDAGSIGQGVTVQAWGGDVIIIEGTMGDASGQASTAIYGDVQTGSTSGGADTISVARMVGANTSINAGGGDDNVTVTDMQEGTILLGEGADTANIGGIATGTRTIDMGLDSSTDTINLDPNGSGAIIIKNINALTDKVFLGTTDVTADVISGKAIGNYGPVQLVDPVGVDPIITFNESAINPFDGTNDGNIAFENAGVGVQRVEIIAKDGAGQPISQFYMTLGDTSGTAPADLVNAIELNAGTLNATNGDMHLSEDSGFIQYQYTINGNAPDLAPGAKGTETFTLYAVDANGSWTAKVINVVVEGDGVYSFNGTAAADSIDAPGLLTSGTISTLGGNDSVTLGGMSGGASTPSIDTGIDDDTIKVNSFLKGEILAGQGADTITVGGVSADGSVIDVAADSEVDKIYLTGSGKIDIRNFEVGEDELYINNVLQTVTGDDTYGGYELTFTGLMGIPPTIDTENVEIFDSEATFSTRIKALDANGGDISGSSTFQAMKNIGDTNLIDVNGGSLAGTHGTLSLTESGGIIQHAYTANRAEMDKIKPGEIVTETFFIKVRDAAGEETIQEITITIRGDETFSSTSGDDDFTFATSLENANINLGDGTDKLTITGAMAGGDLRLESGAKDISIFGGMTGGTIFKTGTGTLILNVGTSQTNDIVHVDFQDAFDLEVNAGGNLEDSYIFSWSGNGAATGNIKFLGLDANLDYSAWTFGFDNNGDGTADVDLTDDIEALLKGTPFTYTVGGASIVFTKEGTSIVELKDETGMLYRAGSTASDNYLIKSVGSLEGKSASFSGGLGDDILALSVEHTGSATLSIKGDHGVTTDNAGNDSITVLDTGAVLEQINIYGEGETIEGALQQGHDSIIVKADIRNVKIYGDAETVDGVNAVGHDTIVLEGNVGEGVEIYGDAKQLNNSGTATGNDKITVEGIMSGDALIDAGHGIDTIIVGKAGVGMTGGTIIAGKEDTDADNITVYVGDVNDAGDIVIELGKEDSITLYDAASSDTHVTIEAPDDRVAKFMIGATDITDTVNDYLAAGTAMYTDPGTGITIHFGD